MPHLTDFPDHLPAMLVKELRQGMRARGFTMLFLTFQGLLTVILLIAGSAAGADNAGAVASGIIFTLFAIAVLGIQPMRGVAALSSEVTGNTIEMMVLTRLSARRIVMGKWLAIVSQSALILTTIVPYLILRYFFGGMVLAGELMFLLLIFLSSMAMTAVTVGLSGGSNKLVRALPFILFIFLMQSAPMFLFRGGMNGVMEFFSLSSTASLVTIGCYIVFIAYYGWCALSFGISSIAPRAENHTSVRRLVALVLALAAAAAGLHSDVHPMAVVTAMALILAPAVLVSLTEPSVMLPPLCKPFIKRGPFGRFAAWFLLPGWPAGVFFTTLLLAIAGGGFWLSVATKPSPVYNSVLVEKKLIIAILAITGGVLLPAMLCAFFSRLETKRAANYIFFLVGSVLLTVIPQILTGIGHHEKWLWALIWNPPIALLMISTRPYLFDTNVVLGAIIIVDGIILGLLLLRAAAAYHAYRPVFEEVGKEMQTVPAVSAVPEP